MASLSFIHINNKSQKAINRSERKKRKVQAFLNLVEDQGDMDPVTTDTDGSEVLTNDGPTNLRVKRAIQKREMKMTPRVVLLQKGYEALSHPKPVDILDPKPVDVSDVQSMILACLIPSNVLHARPLICDVQRSHVAERVTIFVMDGGVEFVTTNAYLFQHVISFQPTVHLVERLTLVPMSQSQTKKAPNNSSENEIVIKKAGDFDEEPDDPVSRIELLLTLEQLVENKFPCQIHDEKEFFPSLDYYSHVMDVSPMFSLDCEMCLTVDQEYEVTRITVINEQEDVVLETFCLPKKQIIDYKTEFSGVRKEDLEGLETTIEDVREMLKTILPPDAILIGQSLESDLKALGIYHPYIIDTSIIYNLSGNRAIKTSLKNLAKKFLGRMIQTDHSRGHCSQEDAVAALNLVQLKMKKGIKFGDVVLSPEKKERWWRGSSLYMPITPYVRGKGVKEFSLFYDYVPEECVSRSMTVFSSNNSRIANDTVLKTVSTLKKSICVVVTFDGRCLITAK